jgi:hypothetical protein
LWELIITIHVEEFLLLVPFGGVEKGFFLVRGGDLAELTFDVIAAFFNTDVVQLGSNDGVHWSLFFNIEHLEDVVGDGLDLLDTILFLGANNDVAHDGGTIEFALFKFLWVGAVVAWLLDLGAIADIGDLVAAVEVNGLGDVEHLQVIAAELVVVVGVELVAWVHLVQGVGDLALSLEGDLKSYFIGFRIFLLPQA